MLNIGDKVKGTFWGIKFTGTLRDFSSHTLDWEYTYFFVDFDSPITVFGLTRESGSLLLATKTMKNLDDAHSMEAL